MIVSTEHLILAIAIGSLVLGMLLAWLIGRAISKPVIGLCAGMRELAEGNFEVVLPGLGRGDEVGDMAQAVETFKVKAEQKAHAEAEAKVKQDQLAAQQRKADMIKLADTFEAAVGEIVETVSSASTELEASASTLTTTAERPQEFTTMVAAASEEASTNVQSVASATEELSSSVNEISRQVQESARIANDAVDQARKTNDRVAELSKAAARIGDVVELINTIAGQTNLLALNATIEAARAGEAGRGFAVVASEVKALAEQTAKATGEIGQQIIGIQAATQESVGAIKEISGTIERLSEISSTIAAAVEEQGAATQEISRNVQQAAQGTSRSRPTSPTSSAAPARPDRLPRRCCPRRKCCPATATGSRPRSESSSTRYAPLDQRGPALRRAGLFPMGGEFAGDANCLKYEDRPGRRDRFSPGGHQLPNLCTAIPDGNSAKTTGRGDEHMLRRMNRKSACSAHCGTRSHFF